MWISERERYKKESLDEKNIAAEFSNFKTKCESDMMKKNELIASLEQQLNTANKNLEALQKELKIKETVSLELEKGMNIYVLV